MPDLLTPTSAIDASALELEALPLDPGDVEQGSPRAAIAELLGTPSLAVGVWELSEGVVRDTEVDEVFVVLSGRAEVEVEGSAEVLRLVPGVVGRLAAGSRTRWTVTETLRKVYVTASALEASADGGAGSAR
ncbi:cupin domain-containing protein [Herbiconiux sp. CPCC 205716]|uniref:Cupin domain-containing protein n=1 Tax=Herbiconiux gentiana TaxID=2970912 RepID=A0ABT2GEL9_9MICO|nr:cupin domain-containing protein [Herbiconiux gentiana]MCS5714673.1 cupin domain-containing protein [Herbiconiux gentiana]